MDDSKFLEFRVMTPCTACLLELVFEGSSLGADGSSFPTLLVLDNLTVEPTAPVQVHWRNATSDSNTSVIEIFIILVPSSSMLGSLKMGSIDIRI
jgi:hypothetical protein